MANNKYEALLLDGCIVLSPLDGNHNGAQHFPEKGQVEWITCVQLTTNFLIYGTTNGSILYYHLDNCGPSILSQYRHLKGGIARSRSSGYAQARLANYSVVWD